MELKNIKVLTIVSDDYDDLELWYPIIRLREAGATVLVAAEKKDETYHGKSGLKVKSDLSFDEVNTEEFSGLLIPGGWAPDYLRRLDSVMKIVKEMNDANKVIGQICHAGWVLSSADLLKGKTVTSTPGIKHDLMHAGANWVDKPAVVDGNIISARRPPDLPDYLPLLIEALKK